MSWTCFGLSKKTLARCCRSSFAALGTIVPATALAVEAPQQVPSPDWRDQVIYFVLTDRFMDGDPRNNDQGAGEYNPSKSSHFSGGDLAGIRSRLSYIQQLGATALWITPPVANQWWSRKAQYGGYHGYWATDFQAVDAHLGTLDDYKALARDLHQRQMYLIQDIVVNHTGTFFGYQGAYDPTDTAKNFVLYETPDSRQPAPTQSPFDLINRHDPSAAAANIYHWTPPIQNMTDPLEEFRYQLSDLADLNTSEPAVRQALKQSYRFWLEQVGVDAFRIDTAKYVEHAFWRDFLHAPDGIFATARQLGKHNFLAFGEVFAASQPFQDDGEQKLKAFLGTKAEPQLNSVIAFPLYFDLNAVLAEGRPPALLGYRLQQHMAFPQPHLLPTFVNNHDTKRFLAAGSVDAFIQAYALMFTIPGIPVIYQGDEQLLTQTRQAMFQGGWGAERDSFDPQSRMYQLIQSLATLRREHPVLSRGTWSLLQADTKAAGILAYQMRQPSLDSERVVLFNTADSPRLLANLALSHHHWRVIWQHGTELQSLQTNAQGQLIVELPPRAVLVLAPLPPRPVTSASPSLMFTLPQLPPAELTKDFVLQGRVNQAGIWLTPVLNGDFQALPAIQANAEGAFELTLPVRDLGEKSQQLQLYAREQGQTSPLIEYRTRQSQPQWQAAQTDPLGDDRGPTGQYRQPTQPHSQRQLDIRSVQARAGGSTLELDIAMAQISQYWAPANGFDNVHFAIFFQLPRRTDLPSATDLPGLNTRMPQQLSWQFGHFMFGWGNAVFTAQDADQHNTGKKLGAAPEVQVDVARHLLKIRYNGETMGIRDWADARIYISTWDKSGEGQLRDLQAAPAAWSFSGGASHDAKVMDDIWIQLQPVANGH